MMTRRSLPNLLKCLITPFTKQITFLKSNPDPNSMSPNARPLQNHSQQLNNHNRGAIIQCCAALCCPCSRLSFDSSTSSSSNKYTSISRLAHAMVQERLTQMIAESKRDSAKRLREERRRKGKNMVVNSVMVMMAMEKRSVDPRRDFRNSMEEMIMANRIEETKDLRYLLNCYISMNSEEYRGAILEAFYEVCSDMFFSSSL